MSTWWYEFNERAGFPRGFPDFVYWLNQVQGWSKEKCEWFAILYKTHKQVLKKP